MIPSDEIRNCQGLAFMWTYKVGMFSPSSAGNGMVIRKRRGSGGDIEWSLPCAISFGGAGAGWTLARRVRPRWWFSTRRRRWRCSGQHVKLALDAQACAGPVGRAVEGAVAIAPVDPQMSNFDTEQYTTYGTSEGLFAGLARTPPGSAYGTRRTRTITGGRCRDGTYWLLRRGCGRTRQEARGDIRVARSTERRGFGRKGQAHRGEEKFTRGSTAEARGAILIRVDLVVAVI